MNNQARFVLHIWPPSSILLWSVVLEIVVWGVHASPLLKKQKKRDPEQVKKPASDNNRAGAVAMGELLRGSRPLGRKDVELAPTRRYPPVPFPGGEGSSGQSFKGLRPIRVGKSLRWLA